jgi:hypothetical protein
MTDKEKRRGRNKDATTEREREHNTERHRGEIESERNMRETPREKQIQCGQQRARCIERER